MPQCFHNEPIPSHTIYPPPQVNSHACEPVWVGQPFILKSWPGPRCPEPVGCEFLGRGMGWCWVCVWGSACPPTSPATIRATAAAPAPPKRPTPAKSFAVSAAVRGPRVTPAGQGKVARGGVLAWGEGGVALKVEDFTGGGSRWVKGLTNTNSANVNPRVDIETQYRKPQ